MMVLAMMARTMALIAIAQSLASCGSEQSHFAAPLSALLDFSDTQTALIVGASADRPPRLDHMLIEAGQPDPGMLWQAGLRTTHPFTCQTPTRQIVRCKADLGYIKTGAPVGFVDVMMLDHDIPLSGIKVDLDAAAQPAAGRTIFAATQPLPAIGADGNRPGPSIDCREAIGVLKSGPAFCMALVDPRTLIVVSIGGAPGGFSAFSTEVPAAVTAARLVAAATRNRLSELRGQAIDAKGNYTLKESQIGPNMPVSAPGWYISQPDVFGDIGTPVAGPYADLASCKADLGPTTTIAAAFTLQLYLDLQCDQRDSTTG